ncbi:hypothetical protein [Brasilonema bromeliae]|uniref:Uncharacterized protein n=1 Tax=Brasilonema bromeliae SPC951 TaxID=385972 RepID=A0ABX1P968_9CYAN|nr:hypothetical protein [Brasilonema bromeliae]NMG20970.1 hypothetical protein [Brasilonema bromeliae SPC951]
MSKLVKKGCIVLLAGTALSMIMGVQGAKADHDDKQYNYGTEQCNKIYGLTRELTREEFQACDLAIQKMQRNRKRPLQYEQRKREREDPNGRSVDRLRPQEEIIDTGTEPITP